MKLKGSIIKPRDSDSIGILIEFMEYNLTDDVVLGKVRYFSLFPDSDKPFEEATVVDDLFKCSKKAFSDRFVILVNPEEVEAKGDFSVADWRNIREKEASDA